MPLMNWYYSGIYLGRGRRTMESELRIIALLAE
jgi:hypothetical protein